VSDVSVRDRRDTSEEAEGRAQGLNIGWTASSYLLSGMAAYGGIGWLIGRAVHIELLFPIGMLVGLAISIGFIIWRFGTAAGQRGDKNYGDKNYGGTNMTTGMSAAVGRRASHRRGLPREEKSR
jgi:ATP synthase protein I